MRTNFSSDVPGGSAMQWLSCILAWVVLTGTPALAAQRSKTASMASQIAANATEVASKMDTVGWCYAGVKEALRSVGVALSGAAAWMAAPQLQEDERFAVVNQSTLHRGDILVHGKSATHPYGHISVYLGNGVEASDHIQHLILNGSYGKTVVFRPRGASKFDRTTATQIAAALTLTPRIAIARTAPIKIATAAKSSAPPPKQPAATPAEIAQAKHTADLYTYLYQQGAVSRNEAESKIAGWRALQPGA